MRRAQRLIAATVLIALTSVLSGCGGGGMSGFDPSDLLDFLDTKKKLPGERKAVFPEGVPGLQPGVPKDLYKGAAAEPPPDAAPTAPAEPPKSKRASRSSGKSRPAAPAPQATPDADTSTDEGNAAAAPPAPAKRVVRRRTTAPPPDQPPAAATPAAQQQAQPATSAFPAPLPSGTFAR